MPLVQLWSIDLLRDNPILIVYHQNTSLQCMQGGIFGIDFEYRIPTKSILYETITIFNVGDGCDAYCRRIG